MAANTGRTPFFIVIILLLLLINGALFYFNTQGDIIIEEQTETIKKYSDDIAAKKKQLIKQKARIDSLSQQAGISDSLRLTMEAKADELNTVINSLNKKNNFNKRKLDEAQNQINYFTSLVDNFELQIGRLKKANEDMSEQIRVEQEDNLRLVQEVEEKKADIQTLQQEKEEVITEKTQLSEAKEMLEEKVQIASILQLSRNYIKGYKTNRRGKIVYTEKAKKTERLEACIEIMPNPLVQDGPEDFTIVITNAKGKVIPESTNGKGGFTSVNGENRRYTDIMTADYSTKKKGWFCGNWVEESKFSSGKYTLEVFYKGNRVGYSEMVLD